VSIDGDTAVVGSVIWGIDKTDAYVFSRDQGGPNASGQVAVLPVADPGSGIPGVSVSGNTAIVSLPYYTPPSVVHIFRRNQGGPNVWGEDVSISPPTLPPAFLDLRLDGNVMLTRSLAFPQGPAGARIFARNEGGTNAWGEVARIQTPASGDALALAVSGDTVLVGSVFFSGSRQSSITNPCVCRRHGPRRRSRRHRPVPA
jgi:hypothetical protein